MANLNIISCNVRPLNSPIKRTRCFEFLHRKQIYIVLIQETHLTENNVQSFQNKRYKLIAHSCAFSKTRGGFLLTQRKLPYTVIESGKDNNGRFVYVLFLPFVTGDFNAILCPEWDRSSGSSESMPPSSLSLGSFLTDLNLVDIWRLHNNKVKASSFHSGHHGSSSRIDYIFVSLSITNSITHIDMLPILISDHTLVVWILKPGIYHPKVHRWRFKDFLLGNESFLSHMNQHNNNFITHNKGSCNDAQILWETDKCFMMGVCIGFSSRQHSERNKRLNEIERETKRTEEEQLANPSVANAQLLTKLKGGYHTLSLAKAEFILHRTKQRYYYDGDRPGSLLALRLKRCESKATINAIRTTEGTVITQLGTAVYLKCSFVIYTHQNVSFILKGPPHLFAAYLFQN
uniref:exodeoxyribonuclease III n=1 Tax=Paramormyrops kingsleyae TaxID=1676925 RepID=A0A3B3QJJ3_9TELE